MKLLNKFWLMSFAAQKHCSSRFSCFFHKLSALSSKFIARRWQLIVEESDNETSHSAVARLCSLTSHMCVNWGSLRKSPSLLWKFFLQLNLQCGMKSHKESEKYSSTWRKARRMSLKKKRNLRSDLMLLWSLINPKRHEEIFGDTTTKGERLKATCKWSRN